MSKILVLAEKPSVGRDIARVLKCTKNGNGFIEGEKYVVTWALGHLVTLADPESYGDEYKSWNIEHLPIMPSYLKTIVIKKSGKQFSAVKHQLNRKDISEIIIATDAGREGELVARWIIGKSGVKKPVKRLWISSVTDKAIKDGFNNLKPGKQYESLWYSAVARAEADWYVGINATRALTCKHNAQLSCGRVQTPTLAIIGQREDEIRKFKAKEYYGLVAESNGFKLTWKDKKTNNTRSFNKEFIEKKLEGVKSGKIEIKDIKKSKKKSYAPKLYDLTELQRDANIKFGFSAKETLSIMQSLYERHKVLTYPRTDSRYITTDMVDTLKDRVKVCAVGPYSKFGVNLLKSPIKENKSFVDNSKVSDHHAIIPTEEKISLNSLDSREIKIYDLVVKRFLAVLMPPSEYEEVTVTANIAGEVFGAKGQNVISQGWKAVYGNITEDESGDIANQRLPQISEGDTLPVSRAKLTSGKTTPPAYFNEATLLSAMENPMKYMEEKNKELAKTLEKTGGLGTVATRADIIDKLFNSFLIEKKGKDIHITSKGKQLLELVPSELKSPTLTAEWESKLENIAKGKLNKNDFINEMKGYTKEIVGEIKGSQETFKHDNMTRTKCPECGKFLLEVKGKKGKMLVCQDRECGYRKGVSKVTNARCPECKKKMEMHGEGENKVFICKCGHKEKLSTFNERKKKQKGSASKRDVNQYLKNQNKDDEPMNNEWAAALAKFKK